MRLTKLIYASNHGGQSVGALRDVLNTSRANNERDGITGVLVAGEEDFMQLLEGGKEAVATCFMRIMKDKRHRNIRIIQANDTGSRLFAKWSMHCIQTSRVDKAIMSRYLINGGFYPTGMSQTSLEGLCDDLALRKIWG